MKDKSIDSFIRYSIKMSPDKPNLHELQLIFDAMSTSDLSMYWAHFVATHSFTTANHAVPDWETKRQKALFIEKMYKYSYIPKEKDANGKYIVNRDELEGHIKKHLLQYIDNEHKSEVEYNKKPLFIKIHDRLGLFMLIMAIPSAICMIIKNAYGLLIFYVLWALYILMAIARVFLHLDRKSSTDK